MRDCTPGFSCPSRAALTMAGYTTEAQTCDVVKAANAAFTTSQQATNLSELVYLQITCFLLYEHFCPIFQIMVPRTAYFRMLRFVQIHAGRGESGLVDTIIVFDGQGSDLHSAFFKYHV